MLGRFTNVCRPELSREREPRKDLIKFAFWTCSQLESDLLADLDLPRSGIQDLEVGLPKGYIDTFVGWHDPDALMMAFYSAQIHIRNRLNDIQMNLHPSGGKTGTLLPSAMLTSFQAL